MTLPQGCRIKGETIRIVRRGFDVIPWANLPDKIYLSFDIDGLDPKLCPHTGTPVAGGFEVEQVLFLLEKVVKAGKKIIAFDLNEVAPGPDGDEWDANVAARLLYRIANLVAHSNGKKG